MVSSKEWAVVAHTLQPVCPSLSWKVPASHASQVPCRSLALKRPGLHGVSLVEPRVHEVLAEQVRHCSSLTIAVLLP